MTQVRRAMVMAAGKGLRMRPLTESLPKPLVKLGGHALIDHVIDRLEEAGIEEIVVNVHHLADLLEAHLQARMAQHRGGAKIVIVEERAQLLETGGGVRNALGVLGDEPVITFNSDSVWVEGWGTNLTRLIQGFDPARMDALLMLADMVRTIGHVGRGDFTMDGMGHIARRESRSTAPFVYAGVQIVKPGLFADGPPGAFSTNVIWDRLIERGTAFGQRMQGVWMHVGTLQDLATAEAFLKDL